MTPPFRLLTIRRFPPAKGPKKVLDKRKHTRYNIEVNATQRNGVTVALQTLTLSVGVRIPIPLPK